MARIDDGYIENCERQIKKVLKDDGGTWTTECLSIRDAVRAMIDVRGMYDDKRKSDVYEFIRVLSGMAIVKLSAGTTREETWTTAMEKLERRLRVKLQEQKDAGKRFLSDKDIDDIINEVIQQTKK